MSVDGQIRYFKLKPVLLPLRDCRRGSAVRKRSLDHDPSFLEAALPRGGGVARRVGRRLKEIREIREGLREMREKSEQRMCEKLNVREMYLVELVDECRGDDRTSVAERNNPRVAVCGAGSVEHQLVVVRGAAAVDAEDVRPPLALRLRLPHRHARDAQRHQRLTRE